MNGPGYLAVAIQPGPQTDESAFHEWYDTEHGPLRLRLPFITTGDRYKAADGQKPAWSAVYDVSELSWIDQRIYSRLREERSKREKQVMSTFESLERKIYSLVSTRGQVSDSAPVTVAVSVTLKEEDVAEFDRWHEEEHIAMLSKVPGWLRTRRFKMVVGGSKGMPPSGQVECLAVHDYEKNNGLEGPESKAAQETPWGAEMMKRLLSNDQRVWAHHIQFEALEEPPSSVITTDGAELRFQVEGDPSAPVIVFVNSILTNFHIWDDVAKALITGVNGKNYRVVRYNSRGYSQQAERSNDTRFDLLADDLEYLLQRLNIPKVHAVVGVSMGGVTSINFAIRHPTMLEKFVACDCNVAASPANNQAWADRIELARTEGMPALADVTVKRWFTPPNHGSPNAKATITMVEDANLEGFAQSTGALCNYDLKEKLSHIRSPGLLIAGEGDGKLPEVMQKFDIPDTTFKSIARAGHLPIVDNSEAARNGDYLPSRWDAQADAVNLIFHSKTESNPESSVGLMSMGGSGPEVLTTLTTNPGKVLDGLHRTKVKGDSHLYTGIMIASLALKHRQNKSQRQRIIVFVCSPIQDDKGTLVKLAKKMKKNNTSIDLVAFGDLTDDNLAKLQAFNENVKGGDGSHLEVVQPGTGLLSDRIVESPILDSPGASGRGANGAGADADGDAGASEGFEFGVDPSLDPELALVLRMSMEEERERQAREQKARDEAEGKTQLDSVPEEGKDGESAPLLDKSGDGSSKKDGGKDDDDKMDTA
nr:26s proteasome regulatory subunit rpn10 [Quercus suber]